MPTIVVNYAGVFSTFIKFLQWKLIRPDSILFWHNWKSDGYPESRFAEVKMNDSNNFVSKFLVQGQSYDNPDQITYYYPDQCLKLSEYPEWFSKLTHRPQTLTDPEFIPHFQRLNQVIQELYWTSSFAHDLDRELSVLKDKKVVAIMTRLPNHYYSPETIFDVSDIKEFMDANPNFYYIHFTQCGPQYDHTRQILGNDRRIDITRKRFPDEVSDWNYTQSDEEYLDEIRYALTDVWMASQCQIVFGGSSNMMVGVKCFNPTIEVRIMKIYSGKKGM